ncbi:hypothetical protein [Arthrobacter sp. CJ23]|nr:hypothetical protein [Arthrobacter sp. CJ23]UVJ41269.1 hypothetical protein NVV90_09065 [Arthrobacter sp. CJ23]
MTSRPEENDGRGAEDDRYGVDFGLATLPRTEVSCSHTAPEAAGRSIRGD